MMTEDMKSETPPAYKADILVVDDTHDNLHLLTKLLVKYGYYVRPVSNGQKAIIAIQDQLPDLILLDILMPEMDGYEVCRRLKQDTRAKDIPVIFLSCLEEIEDKIKGFNAGGVDYIAKPFSSEEVLVRVDTQIKNHLLQKQLKSEKARFESLAEATFEGIFIHNDGYIIDVNQEALRLFDCQTNHMVGNNLRSWIPGEFQEDAFKVGEPPCEAEIVDKKGLKIPVEIQTRNIEFADQKVCVTAIRNLSRQKKIEQENIALHDENINLRKTLKDRWKFGKIIGQTSVMQNIYEFIVKTATSQYNVMIYGESGTGKELVAQTIHSLSPRSIGPFVAVNCGAMVESLFESEFFGHRKGAFTGAVSDTEGFFETADGGTMFLDEFGELSPTMQVKLLRVLENSEFTPVGSRTPKKTDIRIIAATNKDLPGLVKEEKFREDIFYRINVLSITIPPLRDRRADIPLLIKHFLMEENPDQDFYQFPVKVIKTLYHYDWPGNVRELLNTVKRYLVTGSILINGSQELISVEESSLPDRLDDAVATVEQQVITKALTKTGWHQIKAAELLGISRRTMHRKMAQYGLKLPG